MGQDADDVRGGCRWEMDRASGVLVADKQSKGESGRVRMGDESRGNPFVLTEQEEWESDVERDEGERERERKQEGANSHELVRTRKKSVLLRALGAQPRRRKPAFFLL
jgi:hypothetical protein